jgi:hypothetical protein
LPIIHGAGNLLLLLLALFSMFTGTMVILRLAGKF